MTHPGWTSLSFTIVTAVTVYKPASPRGGIFGEAKGSGWKDALPRNIWLTLG